MGRKEELAALSGRMDASLGVGAEHGVPGAPAPGEPRAIKHLGTRVDRAAKMIEVARIEADPEQPRRHFDPEEIERLAASLETEGQLQPIRVKWSEGRGMYVIISGERRFRAAKHSGKIPALACQVVESELDAGKLFQQQLVENMHRQDLNPVDLAEAYRRLMETFGCSARQLAEQLHVSHTSVNRALRLLELPEAVVDRVRAGEIAASVAAEISKAEDPTVLAEQVATQRLTRADVAGEVKAAPKRSGTPRSKGAKAAKAPKKKVFKLAGVRITLESAKGLDPTAMLGAARALVEELESAGQAIGQAA
jgi:ParB family chromosome partitioning protein